MNILNFLENPPKQYRPVPFWSWNDKLSSEDMKDALIHPEKHENLIVRVGGYSEYFNRLSPEMKKTLIERTEF